VRRRPELGQLLRRQARLGAFGPVVNQALGTDGVKAMDPVAQRLPILLAELGRRPRYIPHRGKRQKRRFLVGVLRAPGERPKLLGRVVLSLFDR
jgi:hypothetical protein